MSSVRDRIEQAAACEVINLTAAEVNAHYRGAGWKIAHFEEGQLVGFFDPMKMIDGDDPGQEALAWLGADKREMWLVMCSCTQLCEPRRVSLDDASALARMMRVFSDQKQEYS
jgi:hypothetical protein